MRTKNKVVSTTYYNNYFQLITISCLQQNNENKEQALRELETDETALGEDAPQLFADVPPPAEFNAVQIEERVQAFHVETSTLAVDAVNVTKTVDLVQPSTISESSKKQKQREQTQTKEPDVFKKPLKSAPKSKKKSAIGREVRNLTILQSISRLDTNESSNEANSSKKITVMLKDQLN